MNIKKISFILLTFSFLCFSKPVLGDVSIIDNRLHVNNEAFYIKGIAYHPVFKGKSGDQRSFKNLDKDLILMAEAGINTIRVYRPIESEKILNAINNAGIKIIISFGYNQNGFYDIKSGSFINYVKKYKDHPAILIWELGNEYNFNPQWFEGDIGIWYKSLNNAANLIHEIDSSHPVSTSHGEIPDELAMSLISNIDIWGFNVYRWDKPESFIEEWLQLSTKPMYFSEVGADSFMTIDRDGFKKGISEQAQAHANSAILEKILSNSSNNLGLVIFEFHDGWWKAGNPHKQDSGGWAPMSSGVPYDGTANEEYWGIVDIDRKKKLTFDVVKDKFNNFLLDETK
jgi:exo-beta-1,3-glucanase (GH17 family)